MSAQSKSPRRRLKAASAAVAALLVFLALGVLVGVLTDLYELGDMPRNVLLWVRHNGPAGAVAALYAEESGIPVLLPGDVFVVYVGRHTGSAARWLVAWVVMIGAVVLGATNLYWISRRWGRGLLLGRPGKVLHMTARRLDRAEAWFQRYGVWALIFGRHIPGFRIPITVAAGTLKIHYARFAASVAVSSAIWVGVFLYAGARYGRGVERFLLRHGRSYAIALAVILVVGGGLWAVRRFRHEHEDAPAAE